MSDATKRAQEVANEGANNTAPQNQKTDDTPIKNGIITEPVRFETTMDSKLITTIQLGDIINGVFCPMFKDYAGCNIVLTTVNVPAPNAVGPNGFVGMDAAHQVGSVSIPRFEVELYFQKNASAAKCLTGAIDNVCKINETADKKGKDNMSEKIKAMNARAIPGKNLTLTDLTKEMLDEFFLAPYRANKQITVEDSNGNKTKKVVSVPRYDDRLIYEVTDAGMMAGNMSTIYVKVVGLDLIAILRKIYGSTNELGHKVDYEVRSIRPINTFNGGMPGALMSLLQINRLDCDLVNSMTNALGMMSIVNGLPINRV